MRILIGAAVMAFTSAAWAYDFTPPLPPTASSHRTAIANTECSVSTTAIWASHSDCYAWIAEAGRLMEARRGTGPTWAQRVEDCYRQYQLPAHICERMITP